MDAHVLTVTQSRTNTITVSTLPISLYPLFTWEVEEQEQRLREPEKK